MEPSTGKRHKREAIKALYAWLRRTGRITTADDPVMSLPVGQGRVAQTEGATDKVVPRERVLKVIEYLGKKKSRYAHVLTVQAATGWHIPEVSRFVAGGAIEPVPAFLAQPGGWSPSSWGRSTRTASATSPGSGSAQRSGELVERLVEVLDVDLEHVAVQVTTVEMLLNQKAAA